jgi:hypothetical protein
MAWISKNDFLSQSEMDNNAKEVFRFFSGRGWTLNAIAGMLGNMHTESTINPGIWQNLDYGNSSLGYGLVQWTPMTKLSDWLFANGYADTGDNQCLRIIYELNSGLQWISTSEYPMSFQEFSTSTQSPSYLADAFLKCYERPADQNQPNRGTQAEYYYQLLSGEDPGEPGEPGIVPTTSIKKRFNFILFNANRRRRFW